MIFRALQEKRRTLPKLPLCLALESDEGLRRVRALVEEIGAVVAPGRHRRRLPTDRSRNPGHDIAVHFGTSAQSHLYSASHEQLSGASAGSQHHARDLACVRRAAVGSDAMDQRVSSAAACESS